MRDKEAGLDSPLSDDMPRVSRISAKLHRGAFRGRFGALAKLSTAGSFNSRPTHRTDSANARRGSCRPLWGGALSPTRVQQGPRPAPLGHRDGENGRRCRDGILLAIHSGASLVLENLSPNAVRPVPVAGEP
jgi:hypothetical protein